jgi:cobalt-zinc-cadmium efflux system outer membrane protein
VTGDPDLLPTAIGGSLDDAVPELERDPLLADLLRGSPEIAGARAAQDRAEAALARARREPVPDLTVRAGPRYNRELLEVNGTPVGWEMAAEAGFTIPLFNRNQGAIAAGIADVSRAKQEVSRLDLELRRRFASAFDDYLTSLRMAESYQLDLMPRAEESYRLYLARYQGMAAAYPQVLIAQRTLFQVTEAYVDAAESARIAVVRLRGLLLEGGLDMPAMPGERGGGGDAVTVQTASMNSNRLR